MFSGSGIHFFPFSPVVEFYGLYYLNFTSVVFSLEIAVYDTTYIPGLTSFVRNSIL
jgi:hypothetical protein